MSIPIKQEHVWFEGTLEDYIKFSGLSNGIIYESIVTTGENEDVNAAPMGVIFQRDNFAIIKPFKVTKTYELLSRFRHGVINFTDDVYLFYITTFKGEDDWSSFLERSKYVKSPSLANAYAKLEFEVVDIIDIDDARVEIRCKVVKALWRYREPKPYTRAEHATIESLIHATRVIYYIQAGMYKDAERLLEAIKTYEEIVRRVAPSSIYLEIIQRILKMLVSF